MRLVINAASAHMGGAVTYLRNVLRWMPQVAPDVQVVAYAPAATVEGLADVHDGEAVVLVPYPFGRTTGPPRLYFDQVEIPRLLRAMKADVLFSSTGFGTLYSPSPQLLLVRNLAYFDPAFRDQYRALGRSLRKNTLRRWWSIASVRRADAVLFPTAAMRDGVQAHVSLGDRRAAVLHYGIDVDAMRTSELPEGTWRDALRAARADGCRVLLHVSTYAVQKNVETLVEALPALRRRGVRAKLVTTISRERTTDVAEFDALMRRAEKLGIREDLILAGYVPYGALGALYAEADAYVFPSFTESFGHSMVEAMASGLPVVAADTAVNREVCGAAGAYFGAFDAEGCAEQIASVLADGGRRRRISEASRQRAAAFSWRRYAEELADLCRETSRSSSRVVHAPTL